MNAIDFIFLLLNIANFISLVVLTPPHLPYTTSTNCAHLSIDCVNSFANWDNTFVDYIDFLVNCANKSNDCANTLDD
jgi:hypothetical protein